VQHQDFRAQHKRWCQSLGEAKRAAKLFDAAEALRKATGYQQAPRDRSLLEPYLVAARSQLSEAAWARAWEDGHSMTFEDAFVYALEKDTNE
jgi:hypothetical protein